MSAKPANNSRKSLRQLYFDLAKQLEARYKTLSFQDHCYWRIALDNVFQQRWDRVIEKPAHHHLNQVQLVEVVDLLQAYLRSSELLMAHHARSIKFRNTPGTAPLFDQDTGK